jgi:hypothetical protein
LSELGGQRVQRGFGLVGVGVGPRGAQLAPHARPLGFGEMVHHVAFLMHAASGDDGVAAEHVTRRLVQRYVDQPDLGKQPQGRRRRRHT